MTSFQRLGRTILLVLIACALDNGFAEAADAEELRCHERPGKVGYLGTSSFYEVQGDQGTLLVRRIDPGSPAAEAGIEAGDVIVARAGLPLSFGNKFEWAHDIGAHRPGDVLLFTVRRGEAQRTVELMLAEPSPEWEREYAHWVEHLEIQERPEGRAMLERKSSDGLTELTFHRESSCRVRAEVHGRPTPLPLTLAAGLRVVRLLERLRPGDSLTLTVQVQGNVLRAEPARLPPYLAEKDLYQAIQDTVQSDYAHYQ